MHKDTKKFLKTVQKRLGLQVVPSGHHFFIIDGKGQKIATCSSTASDSRAIKNMRGDLRRAGYAI